MQNKSELLKSFSDTQTVLDLAIESNKISEVAKILTDTNDKLTAEEFKKLTLDSQTAIKASDEMKGLYESPRRIGEMIPLGRDTGCYYVDCGGEGSNSLGCLVGPYGKFYI